MSGDIQHIDLRLPHTANVILSQIAEFFPTEPENGNKTRTKEYPQSNDVLFYL